MDNNNLPSTQDGNSLPTLRMEEYQAQQVLHYFYPRDRYLNLVLGTNLSNTILRLVLKQKQ